MNYNTIKELVKSRQKGSIITLTYRKPLKTYKGITDEVVKVTTLQCRCGVRYDNMRAVKDKRITGELPIQNQGLRPNDEWKDEFFIQNKATGAIKLRVANAHGNPPKTTYYLNGRIVEKAEIVPICLASETKSNSGTWDVIDIGIEKIVDFR